MIRIKNKLNHALRKSGDALSLDKQFNQIDFFASRESLALAGLVDGSFMVVIPGGSKFAFATCR